LEAVINNALQYNPGERFSSALDMKNALISAGRKTGALSKTATTSIMSAGGIKPIWAFKCEDEVRGTPLVYQGAIFVGCYDNNLYALNAAEGKFQWKYPTDGGVVSRPAAYENSLFFGSEDKRLHVVNSRTGKVVWTYYTDGPIRSSPRIAEGHIFIGSDDHMLHAVNLNTGRSVWQFTCR
jgi:outer membrane protein assembly factor BamB